MIGFLRNKFDISVKSALLLIFSWFSLIEAYVCVAFMYLCELEKSDMIFLFMCSTICTVLSAFGFYEFYKNEIGSTVKYVTFEAKLYE